MGARLETLRTRLKQVWVWMLRHDAFIYLVFIAIATFFWWGRAMTSSREAHVSLPITYTDIPSEIVFEQELPLSLNITLRDNGKLLRQVAQTSPSINISLADRLTDESGHLLLSADVLRPKIQDILPGSTTIQQIRPETIESAYHRQEKKTVPVVLTASWAIAQQHQLATPPIIHPTEIEIFGKREQLDTIDCILTDSFHIKDLHDTVNCSAALIIPQGIRTPIKQADITLIAEQFTDKNFTLPIQVIDVPAGENVHLFPQQVSITVRVGISHFAQIQASDFQAVCAYPEQATNTLPIQIIHSNPHITQIRTNIREVEYIIER